MRVTQCLRYLPTSLAGHLPKDKTHWKYSLDYVPKYRPPETPQQFKVWTITAVTCAVVFSSTTLYFIYKGFDPKKAPAELYYHYYPKTARQADLGFPNSPSLIEKRKNEKKIHH